MAEHQGFSAEELEEIMPLAVSLDSLLEGIVCGSFCGIFLVRIARFFILISLSVLKFDKNE